MRRRSHAQFCPKNRRWVQGSLYRWSPSFTTATALCAVTRALRRGLVGPQGTRTAPPLAQNPNGCRCETPETAAEKTAGGAPARRPDARSRLLSSGGARGVSWGCGDVWGEMADDPRISQGIVIDSRSVELAATPVGCRVEHAVPRRSPACAGCGRPECRGRLDGGICWTDRRQEQLARRWAPSHQIPLAQLHTAASPNPALTVASALCGRQCCSGSPSPRPAAARSTASTCRSTRPAS